MASLNERLGRLEARGKPGWVPDPEREIGVSSVIKSMDSYRRELDGRPPDPANELTEAEIAWNRQATRDFLPYLLGERERAHPTNWPHLDQAILETKEDIRKLDIEEAQAMQDQQRGASS